MSPETLRFLVTLVGNVTLSAGADDFADVAAMVVQTKRELGEAIATAEKGV